MALEINPNSGEGRVYVRPNAWLKLPSFQVFRIDVLVNGRQHTVEKRYSEFHTLHKMVRTSQR